MTVKSPKPIIAGMAAEATASSRGLVRGLCWRPGIAISDSRQDRFGIDDARLTLRWGAYDEQKEAKSRDDGGRGAV